MKTLGVEGTRWRLTPDKSNPGSSVHCANVAAERVESRFAELENIKTWGSQEQLKVEYIKNSWDRVQQTSIKNPFQPTSSNTRNTAGGIR